MQEQSLQREPEVKGTKDDKEREADSVEDSQRKKIGNSQKD